MGCVNYKAEREVCQNCLFPQGTPKCVGKVVDMVCPYCGSHAKVVDSIEVYKVKSFGMLYICEDKKCGAYVGCHGKSLEPMGRLADKALRMWKNHAHECFDKIWQCGKMSRREAYAWLAGMMEIAPEACHIGMFDVPLCMKAARICMSAFDIGEET